MTGMHEGDREQRIVVGVDGSPRSHAALRWAIGEARLRRARLELVHAWTYPQLGGWYEPASGRTLDADLVRAIEAEAREALDVALADVGGAEDVVVDRAAVEGLPSAVLIAAAKDADLLVVGSRGRGGFAELVLGSVSHQCAQHASCPIVIVREPPAGTGHRP